MAVMCCLFVCLMAPRSRVRDDISEWDASAGTLRNEGAFETKTKGKAFGKGGAHYVTGKLE